MRTVSTWPVGLHRGQHGGFGNHNHHRLHNISQPQYGGTIGCWSWLALVVIDRTVISLGHPEEAT